MFRISRNDINILISRRHFTFVVARRVFRFRKPFCSCVVGAVCYFLCCHQSAYLHGEWKIIPNTSIRVGRYVCVLKRISFPFSLCVGHFFGGFVSASKRIGNFRLWDLRTSVRYSSCGFFLPDDGG